MRICIFVFTVISATVQVASQSPPSNDSHNPPIPATKRQPVTDTYHGTSVTEDYRWLEDFQDPVVQQWSAAQNAYARSVLDVLPSADKIREQVKEILSAKTVSYGSVSYRRGKFFVSFLPAVTMHAPTYQRRWAPCPCTVTSAVRSRQCTRS